MQVEWVIDNYLVTCIAEGDGMKLRFAWADEELSEGDLPQKDAQAFMQFFSHAIQDAKLRELLVQPDVDADVESAFRDYAYEHRLDCWLSELSVSTGCACCDKRFEVRGVYAMRDLQLESGQHFCTECMRSLRGA